MQQIFSIAMALSSATRIKYTLKQQGCVDWVLVSRNGHVMKGGPGGGAYIEQNLVNHYSKNISHEPLL